MFPMVVLWDDHQGYIVTLFIDEGLCGIEGMLV